LAVPLPPADLGVHMHEIDEGAEATRDCTRCGGRAFFWRTAVVARDPHEPDWHLGRPAHHTPAWTCMNCGYIEPHERRRATAADTAERRRL